MTPRFHLSIVAALSWLAPELHAQCPGWSASFGPPSAGDGMNARVYDMLTFDAGLGAGRELIAGGGFTVAGATATSDRVASWNGSAWTNIGSACGTNAEVFALTTYEIPMGGGFGIATPGNELYAGGGFTSIDCVAANHVALSFVGTWFPLLDGGTGVDGTNGDVYAMTPFDIDGGGPIPPVLVVGGQFSLAGGKAANNVALWAPNTWFPLGTCGASGGGVSGGIIPGRVDALCVFDDGSGGGPEVYAGGYFTSIDSGVCAAPASLVAKWNPWSNTWTAVGALTGSNVYDLVVFDDDGSGSNPPALFAGGNFTAIGGSHVAKWDGLAWNSVGVGFDDVVRDLLVYECRGTERLVASGHFTSSGSNTTNLVAYFDGASWLPIGTGLDVQFPPIALCAAQWGPGYDLFVGGIFTQADGQPSSYIAAGCVCPIDLLPVPNGVAAVTEFAEWSGAYPLALVDIRAPFPTPDTNWDAPMFHNEYDPSAPSEVWNEANLGQVFGVCFDTQSPPNIYVAATTTYAGDTFGPGGPGAVYKIDGATGDVSTFVHTWPHATLDPLSNGQSPMFNELPNTGPGLGDICFNAWTNCFYVSNFEDGKIYKISAGGGVVDSYDPFDPDDETAGFAPLGERVWALQVFHPRQLFFSVWLEDIGRPTDTWPAAWPPYVASAGPNSANNAIFSAGLLSPTGAFLGTSPLVEVLPDLPTADYSHPCSDIRFSPDNKRMLLAERGMSSDTMPAPHEAQVLEYSGGTVANSIAPWTLTANDYWVGTAGFNINAAGGADYDCDDRVLATGDALQLDPELIYGLQLIPSGGNTQGAPATSTSYLHDMNRDTTDYDKTEIGDCEIHRPVCTVKWWKYCTSKVNSLGCLPSISATGNPSATASSGFVVTCSDVIGGKTGLLFYSLNGTANVPFQGGFRCVATPLRRTPVQSSGGNAGACDGVFAIDMNDHAASGQGDPGLTVPGSIVDCQWWSRDPASPSTTSLSDALEYVVEP